MNPWRRGAKQVFVSGAERAAHNVHHQGERKSGPTDDDDDGGGGDIAFGRQPRFRSGVCGGGQTRE